MRMIEVTRDGAVVRSGKNNIVVIPANAEALYNSEAGQPSDFAVAANIKIKTPGSRVRVNDEHAGTPSRCTLVRIDPASATPTR